MPEREYNRFFDWRHFVEKSAPVEDIEQTVIRESIPAFPFFFMLTASAVIATLGLLANSAAVIIGAMIIAPLMGPIIGLSYGLVAGKGALIIRALFTVITGTISTICVAILITEMIGWKLAGSEIVSRMRPTLLDLGVALAAGAAAAFAYTRPGISSALAGIAIAVALVPPLCTVGIAVSLGQDMNVEVGIAVDYFSARGPMLLYLTNIIGIIFAGSIVFFFRYHRRRMVAVLIMALALGSLVIVVPPLKISMDELLIRNQVYRNLTIITQSVLPANQRIRPTNLSVQIRKDTIYVRGDVVASQGLITQEFINKLRDRLSEKLEKPTVLEIGIIHEEVLRSTKKANS